MKTTNLLFVILLIGLGLSGYSQEIKTAMEADQSTYIKLNEDDPSKELWRENRDISNDPKREPGPININRNVGGLAYIGIPTFFKKPVALTPEDLEAGNVDIAIMGAGQDMSSGRRGAAYGPNSIRTSEIYVPWGSLFSHQSMATLVDPDKELVIVDYGDAPVDMMSVERTMGPVHDLVKEIAETGTIPFIIGGDHSLMYPDVVAITDVYGKGNVGVIHFDAHIDAEEGGLGHYLTHGSPVRRLIDEGHVKGENFVQIGLRSWIFSEEMLAWMREKGVRYHFMTEIVEKGWDEVMEKALEEAFEGAEYLFISFDLDALDPAFAPAAGTPEPGGLTPREIFPIIRGLCAQNKIVGFEMVELNPLIDVNNATAIVANRILREAFNGIAMHKKGLTDPKYLHPEILNNR